MATSTLAIAVIAVIAIASLAFPEQNFVLLGPTELVRLGFEDLSGITGDFVVKCRQTAECPVSYYCSPAYGVCKTTRPVDLRPATFKVENSAGCWLATLSVHNDNKGKSEAFNVLIKTDGWEKTFSMRGLDRLRTGFVETCIDYCALAKGGRDFQVIVDPENKIPESDEKDNAKTWAVELK
ncbi:MAG: hypothetical protein HYT16_00895 [DPANN group archaeon]|nr:hypothetical protein [DPANN group archaeon]